MPKIDNLELYPLKGSLEPGQPSAIGTDWEDGKSTKNLPVGGNGGAFINQDNKFRYIERTFSIGNRESFHDEESREEVFLSEFNSSLDDLLSKATAPDTPEGLIVTEHQLIVFIINTIEMVVMRDGTQKATTPKKTVRKYLFPHLMGKGTYLMGGFTAENLELIYESVESYLPGPGDMNGHRDVVINLGDIGDKSLVDFLNENPNVKYPNGYPLTDENKDYYFFFTKDEVDYIYYFDGPDSVNGYGFYGVEGELEMHSSDLVLFYNGLKATTPQQNLYDFVPQKEPITLPRLTWNFPPMQRGECKILIFVDSNNIPLPNGSIWVGGVSGVNCGNNTYVRCLISSGGGSFANEGYKFLIMNSKYDTGIYYYGGTTGNVRPPIGEDGVLFYNTETGVTYIWNSIVEDYEAVGSAVEGELISATVFNDLDDNPVEPTGENIYIDVVATPNIIYRWNGIQFVPLGSFSVVGSEWGSISGNIENQTDLMNKLAGKSNTNHTHSYSDIQDLPTIPSDINELDDENNLLFSGSYNDLSDKPTIPAAQVNSDWDAASGLAEIKNKPTVPSDVSELTDDNHLLANFSHITAGNIPKKDAGENMLVDSKLSETSTGVTSSGDLRATAFIGKAIENASVSTTYSFNVNSLADAYNLTLTDNTTFSVSNQPNDSAITFTVWLKGSYTFSFPSGVVADLDGLVYDGTMWNLIVVHIVKTTGATNGIWKITNQKSV
jgi:hypothetical protein